MSASEKIKATHLQRCAYIYVRQSTAAQVQHNRESTDRQYKLAERARRFGWSEAQVKIIDEDLACSGSDASDRGGFALMTTEVALGHIGLILSIEVSRAASPAIPTPLLTKREVRFAKARHFFKALPLAASAAAVSGFTIKAGVPPLATIARRATWPTAEAAIACASAGCRSMKPLPGLSSTPLLRPASMPPSWPKKAFKPIMMLPLSNGACRSNRPPTKPKRPSAVIGRWNPKTAWWPVHWKPTGIIV